MRLCVHKSFKIKIKLKNFEQNNWEYNNTNNNNLKEENIYRERREEEVSILVLVVWVSNYACVSAHKAN